MRDRLIFWLGLTLLALSALACNAFAGRVEPSLPPPPLPTAASTPGPGTLPPGPAPTVTLPGDVTAVPGQGTVRILVDLNVRAGPGVGYERVGFMLRDETAVVLGRDPASGWWKVECPPSAEGSECWISGGSQYTRVENLNAAPTISATATPVAPTVAPATAGTIVD